jgi:hypothetical protein
MSWKLGAGVLHVVRPRADDGVIPVADQESLAGLMLLPNPTRCRRPVNARLVARVLDLGLLAVVIGWSQLDVWAPQITTPNHMVGDSRVLSAASLAAGVALLGRRRRPLATLVLVLGILSIPAVI